MCVMHCVRNCVQVCVCVCVCVFGCVHVHRMYMYMLYNIYVHVSVLINCCLHLLSLQNGLTALEVARASTDKVRDEDEEYEGVSDYDGVVDLLSGYTAEPAVLPSHPVSGTITTSSH